MKFAFCIFKYFPYGGIQRDMLKILRACLARGHEVTVFTLRWEAPDPEAGFEVVEVPIEGFNRHRQYERFAEHVREQVAAGSFDLVFGFNKMPGLDVYYAGDPCYRQKAIEQRPWYYRLLPRFRSFQRAERAVFSAASGTRILTLADHDTPHYQHHYNTPAERFHALPPGIERDRIAPADDERTRLRKALRQEFELADDALVVLFVGSGFIKKGLDRALIALASLPREMLQRAHLFVLGRDRAEPFERMAMRLGVSERVTFFAEGRDDVPRFLFSADALVHPAYDETAGMIIIEAALAGLPALVTANCGYAHYTQHFDAGIVLSADASQEDVNAGLVDLLDADERQRWSNNGITAKDDASLFQMVPTVVGLLEEFAGHRAPLIAFVLVAYFPYGGLQRDFLRIALACQEAGYRILVYTMFWQGEVPDGFEVVILEPTANSNHNKVAQFADMALEHVRWRQAACVFGFNKMPGLDLYYAADSCFEYKARDRRNALYRRTERYRVMSGLEQSVFGADAQTQILFIAPGQEAQFADFYPSVSHRAHLLGPGVSRDRLRPDDWQTQRQQTRQELGLADDELMVLQIGSGFVTKGLDRSIDAVSALPEVVLRRTRFCVVGQDDAQQFERQAKKGGVADQVQFLGGRDDVPALLLAADLMLHPAKMESGGLVLIEGVIAGLPVVTTAVCGFAHYVENAAAGVVLPEPFSQEQLNQTLAQVLGDDTQRQTWSDNGAEFGHSHPELFDMPQQVLDIIGHQLQNTVDRSPSTS